MCIWLNTGLYGAFYIRNQLKIGILSGTGILLGKGIVTQPDRIIIRIRIKIANFRLFLKLEVSPIYP